MPGLTELERLELVLQRVFEKTPSVILGNIIDELMTENIRLQKQEQSNSVLALEMPSQEKPLHLQDLNKQLDVCCNWLCYLTQNVSSFTADKVKEYLKARDVHKAMNPRN